MKPFQDDRKFKNFGNNFLFTTFLIKVKSQNINDFL